MSKEQLQITAEKIRVLNLCVKNVIESPDLQYVYESFLVEDELVTADERLTEFGRDRIHLVRQKISNGPFRQKVQIYKLHDESTNSWLFTTSIPHLSTQQYADLHKAFPIGIVRDSMYDSPAFAQFTTAGILTFSTEDDFASPENLFDMTRDSSFLIAYAMMQIGDILTSLQRATLLQASLTATLVHNDIYPKHA